MFLACEECGDESFSSMDGQPLKHLEYSSFALMQREAETWISRGTPVYNENISLPHQYLLKKNISTVFSIEGESRDSNYLSRVYTNPEFKPAEWIPELSVFSFDIETTGDMNRVLGISFVFQPPGGKRIEEVLLSGDPAPGDPANLSCYPDESSLLKAFFEKIRYTDPDIITGWNVIDFDLAVLRKRANLLKVPFFLGRSNEPSRYRPGESWGGSRMVIRGRQVLDAMHLARSLSGGFEDFRLETVAYSVLSRGKALEYEEWEKVELIEEAYRNDRKAFYEYSLTDSQLVLDILDKEKLIDLAVKKSILIGLPLQEIQGSVGPFEFLYTKGLWERGYAGPASNDRDHMIGRVMGGLVINPKPGLYKNILVFDYKSLYPSLIRTFNIDPLAYRTAGKDGYSVIRTPQGAEFSKQKGILPSLIDRFFAEREEAKEQGNETASYIYKIIMNSFYGVLGTKNCIFASPFLAGSITAFGQHILTWTKDLFSEKGYTVLYGDTDSLFVDAHLPEDISYKEAGDRGEKTAAWVNKELKTYVLKTYGAESVLCLEYEKLYSQFLLPSARSRGAGRSKSYAGLKRTGEEQVLEIVGMEAVRRDWTVLARELQKDLLFMLFHQSPEDRIITAVKNLIRNVRRGAYEKELLYTKRLRKPLGSYTKTSPPHVKAARLLPKPSRIVKYYMTKEGPQPLGFVTAPIDYDHYVDKQILPIVQTLLPFAGIDVSAVIPPENGQVEFLF